MWKLECRPQDTVAHSSDERFTEKDEEDACGNFSGLVFWRMCCGMVGLVGLNLSNAYQGKSGKKFGEGMKEGILAHSAVSV